MTNIRISVNTSALKSCLVQCTAQNNRE